MTQAQLLILSLTLIPLINCFFAGFGNDDSKLRSASSKLVPILFFTCLVGLAGKLNSIASGDISLSVGQSLNDLNLLFTIDHLSLVTLVLLSFLWLIFVIYSDRFLKLYAANDGGSRLFFALTIFLLVPVILSGNLVTVFFFFICLLFLIYLFEKRTTKTPRNRLSQALSLSLYLEVILLFLAVVATQKFLGSTDFSKLKSFAEIDHNKQILLFCLYLVALFLPIITGCFFLYRDAFSQPIITYSLLFFVHGFVAFYVLIRLCFAVSGNGENVEFFSKNGKNFWHAFEVIILANALLMLLMMTFSRNLKTLFFYLFFQQSGFTVFAITLFAIFNQAKIYLVLLSFSLSITLFFLCLSNLILFLAKAENKSFKAALRGLKVNSLLLIFAVVSLCGLTPSIAIVENFFLVKIILHQSMTLSAAILVVNFLSVLVLLWKLILPIFSRDEASDKNSVAINQADLDLARSIDLDSALILTAVFVAMAMMICPIFLSPLTKFLTL